MKQEEAMRRKVREAGRRKVRQGVKQEGIG
jgi:hypothetical protein